MTDERERSIQNAEPERRKKEPPAAPPAPHSQHAAQSELLEVTQEQLRRLVAHLFTAQDEQQERVARELHDDVSQRLSLLALLLTEIQGSRADVEKLEEARRQLSELNTRVRQISSRLHPTRLTDLGLSAALQALVKEVREKMPVTYTAHNLPASWPPLAATAIYGIAQEALRSISRHAGNTAVKVLLTGTEQGLQLKITGCGLGFNRDAGFQALGLGMISMQERACLAGGALHVQSALGQGTTIIVDIPLGREL